MSPSSLPERRRLLLGAFGDPGHAFPAIALGRALAARGHDVVLQTWERWRADVAAGGMRFVAAPEYPVFAGAADVSGAYEAAARLALDILPLVRAERFDAVVADVLTLGPALAAEAAGVPWATLVPHVDPRGAPGFPPFSIGARLPRSPAGRAVWRASGRVVARGLEQGRAELNGARARLGLPPVSWPHGGISLGLCLVGTFPGLEYPRAWPPGTHVVGPLLWEPPWDGDDAPPPGDDPLVLVAPSTSQDPSHALLRAALDSLADLPVRVLAATNRRPLGGPVRVPANARLVDWVSYARTMPRCDAVVCHGGHGTVVRALASGCVVVAVPAAGDMNENAARVDWAGVGVRLPRRLCRPWAVRLAVGRALDDPSLARRAASFAAWARSHDAGARAAELVETFCQNSVRRTN